MRKDWEVKKLRDVCNIEYGFPFNSRLFVDDSTFMPLIRIRDLKTCSPVTFYTGEYDVNYIVHKGDYLIGMDGEFNIVEWKGDNGLLNQRICRIRSSVKELLNQFLLSYLPIPLKKIEDATPFVTVKHLSATKINNIEIPVPPIQIQQHIVEELDCLISIIEKQKKQLEELDNLAQSIFYDMFGDPIENEKGWDTKKMNDLCSKITDGEHIKPPVVKEGVPFLSAKDITNGFVDFSETLYVSKDFAKKSRERCNPEYGNILIISRGATIGKICMIRTHKEFCLLGSVILIKYKETIDGIFLLYFLKNPGVQAVLRTLCGALAQPAIYLKDIKKINVLSPPLLLQQQFAAKIEVIEKQKELIKKSIKETEDLFNSRMDYYFN